MTFIVVAVGHWELVALILEVVSDIHSEPWTNMGMVEPCQEVHDTNHVCVCVCVCVCACMHMSCQNILWYVCQYTRSCVGLNYSGLMTSFVFHSPIK